MTVEATPSIWLVRSPRSRGTAFLLAAVALGAAAFFAAPHDAFQPWGVLGLWAVSMILLLTGARFLDRSRPLLALPRLGRAELVFLAGATLAALLVRTVALESVPWNVGGDEAENGDFARAVLRGDVDDPFSTGWAGHPTVWFFLQALSQQVFGDDVFGLRMLAALLGTAAVPAVYLFARPAFGRDVAAVAALLLLALHVHVHYSRVGLNSGADGLLMLLAVAALVAGLRSGSPLTLAVAGLVAGIAQHFYLGSRLVPFVLAAIALHQVLFNRSLVRHALRGLPLALLGFWIGYGPGVRVPLYHWDDFNARLNQVGVFQSGWWDTQRAAGADPADLLHFQFNQAVGAFTHVADHSPNYLSGTPLLDPVSGAFFVLGIGFCLVAWRRAAPAGLLAWLAGSVIAGGILLVDAPQSHRLVGTAPALCILVALGIVRSAGLAVTIRPSARRPVLAAAAALVAGLMAWNFDFYFREYEPRHLYGRRQGEEITAIGRYLEHRRDAFVYFFGAPLTFYDVGTIRFLAPEVPGVDVHEQLDRASPLPTAHGRRRPIYLFLPHRLPELALVRRVHPAGTTRRVASRADGMPLFVAYLPRVRERRLEPPGERSRS